jgi:hypothetical protein
MRELRAARKGGVCSWRAAMYAGAPNCCASAVCSSREGRLTWEHVCPRYSCFTPVCARLAGITCACVPATPAPAPACSPLGCIGHVLILNGEHIDSIAEQFGEHQPADASLGGH